MSKNMSLERISLFLIHILLFSISAYGSSACDGTCDGTWEGTFSESATVSPSSVLCDSTGKPLRRKLSNTYIGPYSPDTVDTNRNWWHLFLKGKLAMYDDSVEWPRFLKFGVNIYRWADRVFSTTDTAYVVGTGKRWRARLVNDNWTDSYYMILPSGTHSIMSGNMHVLAGASLQYMAVSYTYSLDLSHIIGGTPINYKKWEFGFNCARFSADAYYNTNSGGTYIRTFGDYNNGHLSKLKFPGVTMTNSGIDAYYFFNGYKYSQGAAYNFSKIQKRSQGCLIGGLSYCNQDIDFNFNLLPHVLIPYLKDEDRDYRFHYHDYNILIGYGYNWVINRHLLFNVTAIPGIGFNHCYEDSEDGSIKLFSLGARGMASLTYNNRNWFAGIQGKVRGHWYHSDRYSLFNAIQTIVCSAGFRF